MSKRLIVILTLAFVLGLSLAAYAEVQNVKVSGDITAYAISRNNLDLKKERPTTAGTNDLTLYSDDITNALSIVRVRVDADLTDNVGTTVRLINERIWGSEADATGSAHVDLDLAYATMKEFLYSPLTLTLGRQELHFGNDFIVGDPDTNGVAVGTVIPLNEFDLSARKAFDAVRATLNYDPLVIDVIWAKVRERTNTLNDDTTLSGINANYALNKETNLEGYFFSKITDSNAAAVNAVVVNPATAHKPDKVFTLGGKVRNTTLKNTTLSLESAYQFGTYNPLFDINANLAGDPPLAATSHRSAWALEAVATYDLKDIAAIAKYAPSLTGMYIYLSGEDSTQKHGSGDYHGWDGMYENQTAGHLANTIVGFTNSQIVGLSGKMKPMEDLTFNVDYYYYWLLKGYSNNIAGINLKGIATAPTYNMSNNKHLGQEIDAKLTYDYTEDVQFGLLAGVFIPGHAFEKKSSSATTGVSPASEVIGSMKVTF